MALTVAEPAIEVVGMVLLNAVGDGRAVVVHVSCVAAGDALEAREGKSREKAPLGVTPAL